MSGLGTDVDEICRYTSINEISHQVTQHRLNISNLLGNLVLRITHFLHAFTCYILRGKGYSLIKLDSVYIKLQTFIASRIQLR